MAANYRSVLTPIMQLDKLKIYGNFSDSLTRFVEKFFCRCENSNLLMRKLFFSVLLIDELVDDELFNKVFIDFVAGQQIIRSILYRVSSPCPTFGN